MMNGEKENTIKNRLFFQTWLTMLRVEQTVKMEVHTLQARLKEDLKNPEFEVYFRRERLGRYFSQI